MNKIISVWIEFIIIIVIVIIIVIINRFETMFPFGSISFQLFLGKESKMQISPLVVRGNLIMKIVPQRRARTKKVDLAASKWSVSCFSSKKSILEKETRWVKFKRLNENQGGQRKELILRVIRDLSNCRQTALLPNSCQSLTKIIIFSDQFHDIIINFITSCGCQAHCHLG